MLLGIISDIHGNLPAFRAVLDKLKELGPKRILCAGDLVGYYPFPNEVVELAESEAIHSILGNHDRAVLDGDLSGFTEVAARALEWTRLRLSEKGRRFLRRMPKRDRLEIGGRSLLLVHGSPRDDDEYIFPMSEGAWPFRDLDVDILVMGHTHVQWKNRFGKLIALNPGAVGQPRDHEPRAAFATFETRDASVRLHRVDYDLNEAAEAVVACGLPAVLADRLFIGF